MIIVDCETTGLDEFKNSLLSIGAVEFEQPENQFYGECRVWEGANIDPAALQVNKFTVKEITDPNKKSLSQIISEFEDWAKNIKDRTLAGQNPEFDIRFLESSYQQSNLRWPFGHRYVDLHTICFSEYLRLGLDVPNNKGRTNINLEHVLGFVGLPQFVDLHHNALLDAKLEAEALSRLILKKDLLQEFKKYPIPDHNSK